ncbi:MAG: S1 RNA-binding domain-containing protein [Acidobacteria bacterium]|nr:S1 RNA-binding domain-containing protein [Acidobacteriota bacterium]
MSAEIPALPNEAPEDLEIEKETPRPGPPRPPLKPAPGAPTRRRSDVIEDDDEDEDLPAAAAPAPTPKPAAPPRPAAPPKPAPRPAAAAPPGPAMPAMPGAPGAPVGDDLDDDELDIPDEEEFARLIESQEHGVAPETEPEGVLKGVIVSVRDDGAFVDVGEKSEAFLPVAGSKRTKKPDWKPGDTIDVTVAGRAPDGYLLLSSVESTRPGEWSELEIAYASGSIVVGKAVDVVKGGLAVDVGVRGFLPASRSGERDQESLEALVGHEIRCRIAQLDIDDRNVILDRRALIEEERNKQRQVALEGLAEGAVVRGIVRTIRDFGAFVDLGGVDALLHISDISWGRVDKVESVLKEGDEIDVKVLRVDDDGRRIAVGRKQLESDPWSYVAENVRVGDRVRGLVTRLKDFGAFVELTPGAEGLIHISEMSWSRRLKHPSEVVKEGDEVDVVVLDVDLGKKRVGLGLKQALGDPWDRAEQDAPPGSTVEGVVRKTTNFGAFVEVLEGVEGLLHISDITSDRRLNHPNEVVRVGDKVRVKVLELNRERRRLKLGMKQLEPTEQDKFLDSVKPGDTVTGRVLRLRGAEADVELGEGVQGVCLLRATGDAPDQAAGAPQGDLGSLSARLAAAWQGGSSVPAAELHEGELRSFRIAGIDASRGLVTLELA